MHTQHETVLRFTLLFHVPSGCTFEPGSLHLDAGRHPRPLSMPQLLLVGGDSGACKTASLKAVIKKLGLTHPWQAMTTTQKEEGCNHRMGPIERQPACSLCETMALWFASCTGRPDGGDV